MPILKYWANSRSLLLGVKQPVTVISLSIVILITALFKQQPIQEVIKTDPNSTLQSDSAWSKLRHDSLSTNEKAIYATVDKLLQMPKFQRLQNTLKFIGTGYKQLTNYEIGPWFNWLSANSWEGLRMRLIWEQQPDLINIFTCTLI
ncbi:MAG: hypothetical protein WDM90_09130 [Ferruginibacter sp.]